MLTIDFNRINIQKDETVLDLGCGEGRHTLGTKLLHPEAKAIGLDLSFKDLKEAKNRHINFYVDHREKSNLNKESPHLKLDALYSQGNAYNLPFADETFDHVICSEVLEHIDDYQGVLNEISRIIKPGGTLNISVPRRWPEKICWRFSKAYYSVPGGHVRIFKESELKRNIERKAFLYKNRHWSHALHSPYWWLRCLFWNDNEDQQHWLVRQYHKVLVWDLIEKPWITQTLEKCLNPVMGKSVVMYFKKIEAKDHV